MQLRWRGENHWTLSLTDDECTVLSAPTYENWSHYRGEWHGRRLDDATFRFEAAGLLRHMAPDALDRVAEIGLRRYRETLEMGGCMDVFADWIIPDTLPTDVSPLSRVLAQIEAQQSHLAIESDGQLLVVERSRALRTTET